jgi:hypothetical protein
METVKNIEYLVRDLILILETDYCILIEINYIQLIRLQELITRTSKDSHNTNGGDLAFAKDGLLFFM